MEKAQPTHLSIGDFAEASRLSRKALRLYEERDILRPAYVDPESGYRYYQPDQLAAARLIRALRQIEMPLAAIQQLIAARQSSMRHSSWPMKGDTPPVWSR